MVKKKVRVYIFGNIFKLNIYRSDGSIYDGEWKDNKIGGYGVYIWADVNPNISIFNKGRRYEG